MRCLADRKKHAPPHVSCLAGRGRSALKGVTINRGEPQNWGALRLRRGRYSSFTELTLAGFKLQNGLKSHATEYSRLCWAYHICWTEKEDTTRGCAIHLIFYSKRVNVYTYIANVVQYPRTRKPGQTSHFLKNRPDRGPKRGHVRRNSDASLYEIFSFACIGQLAGVERALSQSSHYYNTNH